MPGSTWPAGKDRRLEALSAAPLVLQTPLSLLAGNRITDKQILFVRNCQDIGGAVTVEPRPLDSGRDRTGRANLSSIGRHSR